MSLEWTWNEPGMSLEWTWNEPGMSLEWTWNVAKKIILFLLGFHLE